MWEDKIAFRMDGRMCRGRAGMKFQIRIEFRSEKGDVVKELGHHAGKLRGLSAPRQQQLNSYALAAAAAGVRVLALTQPSEAKIIYTPSHHVIADRHSYRLDFTGSGITDLTIQNKYHYWCGSDSCYSNESLAANMAGSNQVVYNMFGAIAMKPGMPIGPKAAFRGGLETMALLNGSSLSSGILGSWINVKNRYLGIKFKIKGKTHYGWARFSVEIQLPLTITATLTSYAYETVPNKGIVAGKTRGLDVITVQPASLGRLAAGVSAIPGWRSGK